MTVAGKLLISSLGVLFSGQSLKTAVRCGCSLAQIGEFAFIIASLGMSLGVIADYVYPIVVAVSVITTLTTPAFIKGADRLYGLVSRLLPEKLVRKLERYTGGEDASKEQDGDWAVFLRRYVRVTALYALLMAGVSLIGQLALLPALENAFPGFWLNRLLCAAFCLAGIALFIRPMLDLHSIEYTTLWVKNRHFRLPLITLTALRFMLIVLLLFLPLQTLLRINSLWLLLLIALSIVLIYKSGWLSSAYISAEAQFMANFNERSLHRQENEGTEWLDEKLFVEELPCGEALAGRTLRQLNWGFLFSVNIIKVIRGRRHLNMPSGDLELRAGDRIFLIGRPEGLRSLRLSLGAGSLPEPVSLRQFTGSQRDEATDIYAYAIPVGKDSPLLGKSIKASRLREKYDCMILGLQRNRLPILQPDVNMTMQMEDLVWVLGARRTAEKLLASDLSAP